MGGCESLEELDLTRCSSLEALPDGLSKLPKLKTIKLDGASLIPISVRMSSRRPGGMPIENEFLEPSGPQSDLLRTELHKARISGSRYGATNSFASGNEENAASN